MKPLKTIRSGAVLVLFTLTLQSLTGQQETLQLTSSASYFGDQVMFTIGEQCVQTIISQDNFYQEGFIQPSIFLSTSQTDEDDHFDENISEYSVYPIPSNQSITIVWPKAIAFKQKAYEVLDANGEMVYHAKTSESTTILDISHFSSGVYFIKSDQKIISKIIKL